MALGIISAMPEEVASLLDILENKSILEKGMRTYYHGYIHDKEVVIVFSRWGKVASAITATQLINDYAIDEIIFTGVSGALDIKLNVGDIILGTHLLQHDMDARPLFERFEIPLLNKIRFKTKCNILLEKAATSFAKNIDQYIPNEKRKTFQITNVNVYKGDIISGDEFINSKEKVASLKKAIPEALCVEMEGASVAQVCYEYGIPYSIIRIISDAADDQAPIDFPEFTKTVASKYAYGILENYLLNL